MAPFFLLPTLHRLAGLGVFLGVLSYPFARPKDRYDSDRLSDGGDVPAWPPSAAFLPIAFGT